MIGTTSVKPEELKAAAANYFPWAGQSDETACNFAFGLLMRNLPPRVAIDKTKMHAPTLMAAAGAISGICAQISLLADAEKMEEINAGKTLKEGSLKDGRIFLFGEPLNHMLYSPRDPIVARSRVWNMMVTAALEKGLKREEIPNVAVMFKHVNDSFGSVVEGMPSVPQNAQPAMSTPDLLKLVGPLALEALSGDVDAPAGQDIRANRKSWVAISAQMTGNLLMIATRVMPPALCLTVAMESAIYASKMRANAAATAALQTGVSQA